MEQTEVEQTYTRLQSQLRGSMDIDSFQLELARSADRQQLYLRTTVFRGGNYIPRSVRHGVADYGVIASSGPVKAALVLDEEEFCIRLHYTVEWTDRGLPLFEALLREFIGLAQTWRELLDEYGEQDLVHIPLS